MTYSCDYCQQTYSLVNQDYERDKRVMPKEVVAPLEVIHKCKARGGKWRLMRKRKPEAA